MKELVTYVAKSNETFRPMHTPITSPHTFTHTFFAGLGSKASARTWLSSYRHGPSPREVRDWLLHATHKFLSLVF